MRSHKTFYISLSETPATAAMKIFFNDKDAVHMKNPAEIKITWDAYNLTTNFGAGVQISLWGYREVKTTPEFDYIALLEVCIGLHDAENDNRLILEGLKLMTLLEEP